MNTLSRRDCCRRLAAWAAGAMVAPAAFSAVSAAESDFRLRYVLASCMYGTMKLEDVLAQARDAGCDSVDLWPKPHGSQREQLQEMGADKFADLLKKYQTRLGIITRYDLGPLGLQDEMKVLRGLGGTILVCGGVGPVGLTGQPLKAAVAQFAEKLKPHLDAAEQAGATIAIENHGKNLICSEDSLKWLIELAPSRRLGVALAPYHLDQDPAAIGKLIVQLGGRIAHFYAWEHGQGCMTKLPLEQEITQLPGRGKLDFAPILAALRQIQYAGGTSVFMHPVPRGRPIYPTAAAITAEINRARKHLDGLAKQGRME